MKRKFFVGLGLLLFVLMFAHVSQATVAVQDDGTYEGEATTINYSGTELDVTFNGSTATVTATPTVEVITGASEIVRTTDDSTLYISTYDEGTTTFTLPPAAAGLEYSFAAGVNGTITIDVQGGHTDTIRYLTLDAGDTIDSNGATGDSVTLQGATATWYVVDMGSSAWTDGGAT